MDIQVLAAAVMQASEDCNTEAIKNILRRGFLSDYIFSSEISAWDLFTGHNIIITEILAIENWHIDYSDALGNILLQLGARISDEELTRLLLEKGADVTSIDLQRQTALHIACSKKSLEIIKLLTEKSPAYILEKTDDEERTPLDIACSYGCPEAVEFLLSQGSSVNVKDFREGPLLSAVRNIPDYAVPITSMVLDAGANINLTDYMGRTALMLVVHKSGLQEINSGSEKYSYSDLFMLLIERGCEVNASYDFGKTALHLAVLEKQEILVQKLLISGADINRRDAYGLTPLYYACESGSQRLVDLLIIAGAELCTQNWGSRLIICGNEESIKLFIYVVDKSKQCPMLENLCYITIRKRLQNAEKDAFQLGLPPVLIRRLQLKTDTICNMFN